MSERITIDRSDRYALDRLMEMDHVIQVHEDGTVSEPQGVWAPVVRNDATADEPESIAVESMRGGPEWTLLKGWSSEYLYRGPVMNRSESVGGRLARHILDTPGLYAVVVVSDGDGNDEGWSVAFAECD